MIGKVKSDLLGCFVVLVWVREQCYGGMTVEKLLKGTGMLRWIPRKITKNSGDRVNTLMGEGNVTTA